MKRIVNVLLLLVMAVNFSACVVSARVPRAHWVRGYYFVGPYGDRHWVPGHYR
ncbi:hypothetical protein OQX63_16535 [Pedobacter sp. PF22-3]|uniref:hypothetical protein n=1 Tax=Pedobacter sp. PF22-3 TaxID=2994467 RepID=UPI002247EB0A|nr:hypothetical protein [Pedobacter sp. PF22-3]MCX2495100.1 hypothetical protein [Pedobacter sp. PF22-3]